MNALEFWASRWAMHPHGIYFMLVRSFCLYLSNQLFTVLCGIHGRRNSHVTRSSPRSLHSYHVFASCTMWLSNVPRLKITSIPDTVLLVELIKGIVCVKLNGSAHLRRLYRKATIKENIRCVFNKLVSFTPRLAERDCERSRQERYACSHRKDVNAAEATRITWSFRLMRHDQSIHPARTLQATQSAYTLHGDLLHGNGKKQCP